MKGFLCLLLAVAMGWVSTAAAQGRADPELARITGFGFVGAHVENTDGTSASDIGLSDPEMTQYLRERFAQHFPKAVFTERPPNSVDEAEEGQVGRLWCRIWTVGTSYPIAYFVECRLGSYRSHVILEQSALGYDKRESVAETIRKSLDNAVAELAKGAQGRGSGAGGKPRLYVPNTR